MCVDVNDVVTVVVDDVVNDDDADVVAVLVLVMVTDVVIELVGVVVSEDVPVVVPDVVMVVVGVVCSHSVKVPSFRDIIARLTISMFAVQASSDVVARYPAIEQPSPGATVDLEYSVMRLLSTVSDALQFTVSLTMTMPFTALSVSHSKFAEKLPLSHDSRS